MTLIYSVPFIGHFYPYPLTIYTMSDCICEHGWPQCECHAQDLEEEIKSTKLCWFFVCLFVTVNVHERETNTFCRFLEPSVLYQHVSGSVCACMCVCVSVFMCVCMHVCMYVCLSSCVCVQWRF